MANLIDKQPLAAFLAGNPFYGNLTDGLFFRDKMRAIHRVAPDRVGPDILEIGGGSSGLSKMLYPKAQVVNLDLDPAVAAAASNTQPDVAYILGDARRAPFQGDSFDMVTLFDLLEHVEDDASVAREAMRVLRPGGVILVTTPDLNRWRYPYFRIFRPVAPSEATLFADWGHVRRGYDQAQLNDMFAAPPIAVGGFINGWLALSHDIAFSKLPRRVRLVLHGVFAPFSLVGWVSQRPGDPGMEIAAAWKKDGMP